MTNPNQSSAQPNVQIKEKLDLESFKFCFTVASSLIAELLEKYRLQRRSLRHFVHQLVSVVQSEAIEESLVSLGLCEPAEEARRRNTAARSELGGDKSSLNLSRELSTPQSSLDSTLAAFCFKLFQSKDGWDMEFEIFEEGNNINGASLEERSEGTGSGVKIRAHRLLVCSRCPWFRRALTSGMKESIERRIRLYDCHLGVFTCFLQVQFVSWEGYFHLVFVSSSSFSTRASSTLTWARSLPHSSLISWCWLTGRDSQ